MKYYRFKTDFVDIGKDTEFSETWLTEKFTVYDVAILKRLGILEERNEEELPKTWGYCGPCAKDKHEKCNLGPLCYCECRNRPKSDVVLMKNKEHGTCNDCFDGDHIQCTKGDCKCGCRSAWGLNKPVKNWYIDAIGQVFPESGFTGNLKKRKAFLGAYLTEQEAEKARNMIKELAQELSKPNNHE